MIFTINNKRVSYNPTPKCGCSTTKAMLMEAASSEDLGITADNFEFVHQRNETRFFAPEEADYKFCIVRDPVERFVSGYSNRIVHHRDIPFMEFDDFLEGFNNVYKMNGKVRHHFDPQVKFIGNDPGYYDRVFWIDELEELGLVLTEFSGKIITPKRLQTGGNDNKPFPTRKQRAHIKQMYKDDYEFFGRIRR